MNEDKATRYHRLQRRAAVLGAAVSLFFLVLLVVSGASAALRRAIADSGVSWWLTLVSYVAVVAAALDLLQLPASYYRGMMLERRYELSTQTAARWWLDHAKAAALGLVFSVAAAAFVALWLRWDPARWWLGAAATFSVLLVVLAQWAPVVLLPLFSRVTPLARDGLVERLTALSRRAGAPVVGVFEWRLTDRTRRANAALAGIGRTRRILLSDTLLASHSDDEIEVVLAHELAHHVHRDLWASMAVEAAIIVGACFAADRLLTPLAESFGLLGKTDLAALPLVALGGGCASLLLRPAANALSRAHERRADRFALALTGNVDAFVSAMKRLGAQNLAEERPPRLVALLFATHPPMAARIEAAKALRK